ncbi:ribonuclease III [Periconia macrospinosa]|uniref:Ribonuclease III n=1 Tax=Periconia macrospinosa TaxID=97972 RepID=A0A2V1DAB1_9PLEO|nr:ribonuclease III [Periconia macrospinosa]
MAYFKSLENQLKYSFNDVHLLEEAFVAAGAEKSRPDVEGDVSGNKRLALIGDAVLRLSVLEEWFPSGESTKVGEHMVQDIGTNEKLKDIAKQWKLTKWLKENPCQADQEPRTTLASTVEAVIGAVWLDCHRDLVEVQRLIKRLQE